MFNPEDPNAASKEVDDWLNAAVVQDDYHARVEQVQQWEQAPSAREAHPGEDHLVPLMVVLGDAENEPAIPWYHEADFPGGISINSFRFG